MFRSMSAVLLLSLSVLGMPVLANADTASRSFPLQGFTAIALKGGSNLEVVQGAEFSVTVTGEAEELRNAVAEVHGDTLELSVESNSKSLFGIVTVSKAPDVDFRVTLPEISALKVTGSGEAWGEMLESEALALSVTGSGVIRFEKVAAEQLHARVTGSGDLVLGTVLAVEGVAGITGSGDLRLDNFAGESLSAEIKGSGDMLVGGKVVDLTVNIMGSGDFVGRNLQAESAGGSVMGSGDIVLRRPARESFSVMGSGDIALMD